MADVFISYASEDRNRVRPLAEALQARGFNVWWDRSLAAGQDYTAVIEKELKGSKAVIVVWTQSSSASTFVRDEAGRARDEGRLVPVLLDQVQLPLGFGAFQAEDFTRWNGGANAPQMQLLEEVLKAKLSGRDVDGSAIERRRRKLGARIRLVSVLTVIALVVGIAVGGRYLINPPEPEVTQADLRAELLRLLAEGQLTPEQAIQLAQILEAGALGETQSASLSEDLRRPHRQPKAAPRTAKCNSPRSRKPSSTPPRATRIAKPSSLSLSILTRKCAWPPRRCRNRKRKLRRCRRCGISRRTILMIRCVMKSSCSVVRSVKLTTIRSANAR
ncbi:MAG: toll/interleukin-1 receptor domain-containing protein [Hyphomonadaceae bacterium JAD_PAG50586_4]|nr:MAG: toll/interleukin-1 receptor domain-containing protein [Hyphomonadaceae bacterium JAD_PAG50586_4]